MKESCVQHPAKDPLILIRNWQIVFCKSNTCAAALLSFYEYWYNIKLDLQRKHQAATAIDSLAEEEDEEEELPIDESLLQYHTNKELMRGILHLYGRSAIIEANKFLEEMGVITFYYHQTKEDAEKKRYVLFHPEICNAWIKDNEKHHKRQLPERRIKSKTIAFISPSDDPKYDLTPSVFKPSPSENKLPNTQPTYENRPATSEIKPTPSEIRRGASEIRRHITEITTEKLGEKKQIRIRDLLSEKNAQIASQTKGVSQFFDPFPQPSPPQNQGIPTQNSLHELTQWLHREGLPIRIRLENSRDSQALKTLWQLCGGDFERLASALAKAKHFSKHDFGVNYLLTVLKKLPSKTPNPNSIFSLSNKTNIPNEGGSEEKKLQEKMQELLSERDGFRYALQNYGACNSAYATECEKSIDRLTKQILVLEKKLCSKTSSSSHLNERRYAA